MTPRPQNADKGRRRGWLVAGRSMFCGGVALVLFSQCSILHPRSFDSLRLGVYAPDSDTLQCQAVLLSLDIFGVPFRAAANISELRSMPVVIVGSSLLGHDLSREEVRGMYSYVENGGILFFAGAMSKPLLRLIGADMVVADSARVSITVEKPVTDPLLKYVDEPDEFVWYIGSAAQQSDAAHTTGVACAMGHGRALAKFNDGTAALTVHALGKGRVYYLGVEWHDALPLRQTGKVSRCGPSTDMFMLLVKALYETNVVPGFFFSTAPGGAKTAVLFLPGIDSLPQFKNAFSYAALDHRYRQALAQSKAPVRTVFSANDVIGNFPYFVLAGTPQTSAEAPVLNVPVTIVEPHTCPSRKNKDALVKQWEPAVIRNMGNNAVSMLLIKPDKCLGKIEAVAGLLAKVGSPDVWVGDVASFSSFFAFRAQMRVLDAAYKNNTFFLHLDVPYEKLSPDFSIVVTGFPDVRKIVVRDKKRVTLTSDRRLLKDRWIVHSLAKDQKYYRFQRSLVLVVLLLFGVIIVVISVFFLAQRVYLVASAKKLRPKEYESKIVEILYGSLTPAEKAEQCRRLDRPVHTREILLEQLDVIKGAAAGEIALLYRELGFFDEDLRSLTKGKWHRRARAAQALGKIGARDASHLLEPLLHFKKQQVALAAAEALSRFAAPAVIQVLIDAIKTSDPATAQKLVSFLMPLRANAAVALRRIIEAGIWPPVLMLRAIETLGNLRDSHCVDLLMKILKEKIRIASIPSLSPEALAPYLLGKKVVSLDPFAQRYCKTILTAMGKIGDDAALCSLESLVLHPVVEVRIAALDTIATIDNPGSIRALDAALAVTSPFMAQRIMDTMAKLGDCGRECLVERVSDERDFVRAIAVTKLEEYGHVSALFDDYCEAREPACERARKLLRKIIRAGYTKHITDLAAAAKHGGLYPEI
jgi:HEAT repeat protein